MVHFFRDVDGIYPITKQALRQRTQAYQRWVDGFARNHRIPIEWANDKALKAKGLKREDYVRPYCTRFERRKRFGVYFILKSLEQGPTFSSRVPKYPTDDPNYRILRRTRTRYTHHYFYIRDELLGPFIPARTPRETRRSDRPLGHSPRRLPQRPCRLSRLPTSPNRSRQAEPASPGSRFTIPVWSDSWRSSSITARTWRDGASATFTAPSSTPSGSHPRPTHSPNSDTTSENWKLMTCFNERAAPIAIDSPTRAARSRPSSSFSTSASALQSPTPSLLPHPSRCRRPPPPRESKPRTIRLMPPLKTLFIWSPNDKI
jgi:hypothetical protein